MNATAIRTHRQTGPAHVWSGDKAGAWHDTLCGMTLGAPQVLPWGGIAPEDRCKRCVARLEREGQR